MVTGRQEARGCLLTGLAFSGGIFLFGAALLYLGIIGPQLAVDASQNWIETPCEILESAVIEHEQEDGSSNPSYVYEIYVRFQYNFDDQEYESDRFDFSELKDGSESWKRETVARLPPGSKTVCFVNPENPSEAVLRRAFGSPENPAGHIFLWVASVGLMVLGFLGLGLTLICYAPVNPLDVIFDKVLQLADPEYVPPAYEDRFAEASDQEEPTQVIPADRASELLRAHGELRPQQASGWKGTIPLPEAIASFYREVGPVNIRIEGYGSDAFIPSLSELWDLQKGYRRDATNQSVWRRTIGKLFDRWDSDWIVVAKQGDDDVFIYSLRDKKILNAYGMRSRGAWEPREVYPDLNTMAACLAILGSVCAEAGDDFSNDRGIRPKYLAQAISLVTHELGNESQAEAIVRAAGWA